MKTFFISALCLAPFVSLAQTAEFIEPRNVQSVAIPEVKTFHVKDYSYVLYKQFDMKSPINHDLQLDVYDGSLKPSGSYQIDKTLDPGDANIYEGIFALPDKLVMFKSEYEKGKGSELEYYPFTLTGSRQAGTLLVSFDAEKAMNSGNFEVNASDDGTKIVVLCELPYVKDSVEKTIIYVFDNNFKQLWEKEYRFPYESGKAPHNDVFVSNSGTVYDLKRVPVKKSFDFFTVFTFTNNGSSVQERKMDLGENGTISTYRSAFLSNGDLALGGYYYPDKKAGMNVETPAGTFYVKVSAVDGGMPVDKINPFTPNANIKALYLLAQPDNSVILVGEDEYQNSTPKPGSTTFEYDYDYDYSTIIAVKMGADGSKSWEYSINREVRSRDDGARFLSCYACMMGENLVITYQDFLYQHDGQKHTGIIDPIYGSWRVNVLEKINKDGGKAGESYINDKRLAGRDSEYALIPVTGIKINDSTLFFIGARGMELVGIKVAM
ncbi:MAG: hypothetical protein HY064_05155 [Bacteroidetes bacterium]|nr:hypothetical protein [Bacteroidota bacterium]